MAHGETLSDQIVAEYVFGGPSLTENHKSILSAFKKIGAGMVSASTLYFCEDGSIVVVDWVGVHGFASVEEYATFLEGDDER